MNGQELLRLIEVLHKEKDIDKDILFEAVEGAIASAIKKRHSTEDEIEVRIDRESGEIEVFEGEYQAEYPDMGRIQAQMAKQVIIQKIREAESDAVFSEYEHRVGELVNGTVQRIEGGAVIVNLGRAEGILPRQERIRGENYQPGDRIKALIFDVVKSGQKVKILLTRASPEFVAKLFELEVPEIAERIIEIKAIAREAGFRTKVAVSSYDMRVDCIGACVGIRGTRIKSITDELNEERIDIIRWNDSSEVLIINALRPAQIHSMELDEATMTASVLVPDDQLSLAIGRKGQNVRLATKLAGWDIKIRGLTESVGGPGPGQPREEDPEVAAAREALLQGTSLEAIYSKKSDASAAQAARAGAGSTAPAAEPAGASAPANGGAADPNAAPAAASAEAGEGAGEGESEAATEAAAADEEGAPDEAETASEQDDEEPLDEEPGSGAKAASNDDVEDPARGDGSDSVQEV